MNLSGKRRKFICCIIVFLICVLLMPFIIDWLYKVGETSPIIVLPFSPSDMLSYCAATLGIAISLLALFIALSENDPKIKIKPSTFIISGEPSQVGIEIINEGSNELQISDIGLISPKKIKGQRLLYIFGPIEQYPKRIPAFDTIKVGYAPSELHKKITDFKESIEQHQSKMNKVIYYVRLSNGIYIEYKSKCDQIYLKETCVKEN